MIEHEVHGLDEAIIRARGVGEELKLAIVEAIREAGQDALHEMEARVPRSGQGEGQTIAASLRATQPVFQPGGLGGGGFWEVEVGPGPDAPEHLRYVLEGTGLHGPVGNLIRAIGSPFSFTAYKPSRKGSNVGNIARRTSEGQEPQTEWIEEGRRVAEESISERLLRIDV